MHKPELPKGDAPLEDFVKYFRSIGKEQDANDLQSDIDFKKTYGISKSELKTFLKIYPDYRARNGVVVYLLGVLFTPITLAGALIGYIRDYRRFPFSSFLGFYPMLPRTRITMAIGIVAAWVIFAIFILASLVFLGINSTTLGFVYIYLACNTIASACIYGGYTYWKNGIESHIDESHKFGSARYAEGYELNPYKAKHGLYIGNEHYFEDRGHLLTVAGTRSGKGTNLIIPNLLGAGDYNGSFVVIDPKGENCAISALYQHGIGKKVVVLNPWDLLEGKVLSSRSYNPLDILEDVTNIHLVDDAYMLAEMLVPLESGRNKFFSDSARSIIGGLLTYLAVSEKPENRTLKTLWRWVRFDTEKWDRIIAEMRNCDDALNGEVIQNMGNEIHKLSLSGSNTWGSILSTVLQATEFIKSPALQKSLQSEFDPKTLADGKTVLYVIIPADKLQSHSRWLRLVVTSSMRAVIRKPKERVTFILDEFAALGHLPEIETALSTYAGFNVTVWPILQSLIQLQNNYEKNWETFIANTAVRHFFGIHDNFTAEYVSKAVGETSNLIVKRSWKGIKNIDSNHRALITPDELHRASGNYIFTFIKDLPPTYFNKSPYYEMPEVKDRANDNPYIKK